MANIVELTDRFPVNNKTIKAGKTTIEIKGYVPADTYAEIVNTIANSSFDEGGKYHPEYREIAKRYVIIKHMTSIELGSMSAAELFQATQGGTWYELVEAEINKLPIWAELEQSVDEAINYKLLTRKTSFDELCEILSTFADKMGDTKSLDAIAEKLSNLDDKTVVETILDK